MPPATARQPQSAQGKCSHYGHGPHSRQQCPARDTECHTCKKKEHYSAQCFHKLVADVAMEPDATDHYNMVYLNTIGADQATTWNCTISVNGHEVPFKVDTGAEMTVISKDLWTSLPLSKLKPPTKSLQRPDSKPLKVTGNLCATLQYRGHECTQPTFVVKRLQHNLLGLPGIQALHVLAQVDAISTPIPEQYPTLFKGLGTFKGNSYTIQLKPDAKPFALFTPRNCPFTSKKEGTSWARPYGVTRCDFTTGRTNQMVCSHGRCPQEVQCSLHLHGFSTTELLQHSA